MAKRGKKVNGGAELLVGEAAPAKMGDYRHPEAKRKNNPPGRIAAEGHVPVIATAEYAYNPHLPPVLRFDQSGEADKLATRLSVKAENRVQEILAAAASRALTVGERDELSGVIHEAANALVAADPWLEWTGKREAKAFEVDPVALHIHERVSAQAILKVAARQDITRSLFADPELDYHEAVKFYTHDVDWSNRLILGDSLQVMSSLARREDLAGKVQMIYMDPPYGIKFASNFQPEVGKRDVKDKEQDLTREPEMVKAYRDTWHLGIHSYLSYLRDRLIVAKELLADSGSIFVQMGDDNLHTVRSVMDEVLGAENSLGVIAFVTTGGQSSDSLGNVFNYLLWYGRRKGHTKYRQVYLEKGLREGGGWAHSRIALEDGRRENIGVDEVKRLLAEGRCVRPYSADGISSQGSTATGSSPFELDGRLFTSPNNSHWKTSSDGMRRLSQADRIEAFENSIRYVRFLDDFPVQPISNAWDDTNRPGYVDAKRYVVQTSTKVIERCMLMTSDPGDLVLDPTCGSGTTAYVAEQWGRRWITTDTSRVAVAIARQRLLTARYDFFRTKDAKKGPTSGFVYKTVPHIGLKSIAQNGALDAIFARHELILKDLLKPCNAALRKVSKELCTKLSMKLTLKEKQEGKKTITETDRRRWVLPPENRDRSAEAKKRATVDVDLAGWYHWEVPFDTDADWPEALQQAVTEYRKAWRAKMDEVNAAIAASAEHEELVDQPEVVRGVVRVSGPFTVEGVQPPEFGMQEVIGEIGSEFAGAPEEAGPTFTIRPVEMKTELEAKNVDAYLDQMVRLMRGDGVRFPNNKTMKFGRLDAIYEGGSAGGIHAEGEWTLDGKGEGSRVAVSVGPQYGPVTGAQVVEVTKLALRRGYTDLVFAGFSFDASAQSEIQEYPNQKVRVHLAHIRPDVNPGMAGLLKETPGSQLFTVFGLPRTSIKADEDGMYTVTMEGVDIYNPVDDSITPTGADKVAAWFLDSDYDGQTFCITQAFFPDRGAWEKLAKALNGKNGVIDAERFEALSGTKSLAFAGGKNKRVAVKVIDPRGNEAMSVHRLDNM